MKKLIIFAIVGGFVLTIIGCGAKEETVDPNAATAPPKAGGVGGTKSGPMVPTEGVNPSG